MGYYKVSHSLVVKVHNGSFDQEFDGGISYVDKYIDAEVDRYRNVHFPDVRKRTPRSGKHLYRVNKTEVRRRCRALFEVKQSDDFLAFYSISFPSWVSDYHAYRLLNLWLTKCRKYYGLFSYIWVAERQKNGRVHFHLLTNKRMDIRVVNDFMAVSLLHHYRDSDIQGLGCLNYNGVDVDNVYYPKRNRKSKYTGKRSRSHALACLSKYLTKYLTKGDETFDHLAWYCSRDISNLAVYQCFDLDSNNPVIDMVVNKPYLFRVVSTVYFDLFVPLENPDFGEFLGLREFNQSVYDSFNPCSF